MCDVRPFYGLRYNLQQVVDASSIITPPYDVISPKERQQYYDASPYNIIRLEFGEDKPGDTVEYNKYTRAAADLERWLSEGILVQERDHAFYVIEHRFRYQANEKSRWGLIARVRLEDFETGQIRPHEKTAKEPAIDRLRLLRACRTNISPVMGIVRTENGELCASLRELGEKKFVIDAIDRSGVFFRLWVVTDVGIVQRISTLFANKAIYIADGHHRYKTALQYRMEQCAVGKDQSGNEAHNFVMMSLMDSYDPGIIMLPTHRLVRGLESDQITGIREKISPYFGVEDVLPPSLANSDAMDNWLSMLEMHSHGRTLLGLYGTDKQHLWLLRLNPDASLLDVMNDEELRLWKKSDVFLLQRIILQTALGIDTPEKEAKQLKYTRDALEAKERVDNGEYQLAFYLNPAPVSSVLDTADAGRVLPQKSTYFYPKTPAGLVLNPLWNE